MNSDVSVAPEIAQLMEPPRPPMNPASPGSPASPSPASPSPAGNPVPTVGTLARELRIITGAPQRWWRLVRFDAEHPVHVAIPTAGPYAAWLSILPPGADDQEECACDVVTVVAGELAEPAVSATPLVPGKVRVHGGPHPHRAGNRSNGYTVSVHVRGSQGEE